MKWIRARSGEGQHAAITTSITTYITTLVSPNLDFRWTVWALMGTHDFVVMALLWCELSCPVRFKPTDATQGLSPDLEFRWTVESA